MDIEVVITMLGLLVVVAGHIAIVARWSGKLEAGFNNIVESLEDIKVTQEKISDLLSDERSKRHDLSESVARLSSELKSISSFVERFDERISVLERNTWRVG